MRKCIAGLRHVLCVVHEARKESEQLVHVVYNVDGLVNAMRTETLDPLPQFCRLPLVLREHNGDRGSVLCIAVRHLNNARLHFAAICQQQKWGVLSRAGAPSLERLGFLDTEEHATRILRQLGQCIKQRLFVFLATALMAPNQLPASFGIEMLGGRL